MEIISEELGERGIELSPEYDYIVKRVIHTTADFDYAKNLIFSEKAAAKGLDALKSGVTIVTDTNMSLSGISKPGMSELGCEAVCYMADDDVAAEAERLGTTRAAISVKKAVAEKHDVIYAIGNAPTAAFELVDQINGGFRPRLVICVPVGFVNVVEAKEALMECCDHHGIPYIVAKGRKGGSTVATAVLNALIYRCIGRV